MQTEHIYSSTIVHIVSGDIWAGAEMQAYTLINACKEQHRMITILLNDGILAEKLRQSNIEIHIIDESTNGFPALLKQLISLLAKLNADLVHTHGYKENVLGSLAGFVSRLPSIRTAHGANEFGINFWSLRQSIPALLDNLSARFLQKQVISVSNDLAEKLSTKLPANKITVIPNGINITQVETSISKPIILPGRNDTYKIAFAGRLVQLKRVDLILQIYAELRHQTEHDFELYIVGDGPIKETLVQQSKSLGIDSGTHFLGHRNDIYALMRTMDCLIIASDHEGLPMTVLEAIALKLPVVSHAVGAIPEVLDHGRCGYLVYQQEAKLFAAAIQQCRNESKENNITEKAYEHIQQHYSHTKNAEAYMAIYDSILQK